MSPKELLLQEIEQAPDGLLQELLNLLRLLKPQYLMEPGMVPVEVIAEADTGLSDCQPFRGMTVHLDDPFLPVAESDWAVLQ